MNASLSETFEEENKKKSKFSKHICVSRVSAQRVAKLFRDFLLQKMMLICNLLYNLYFKIFCDVNVKCVIKNKCVATHKKLKTLVFIIVFSSGFVFPVIEEMNNPAFESNGSVSDADAITPTDHRETSLTELIATTPNSMTELILTATSRSRSTSRRPSAAFLSVDNTELNSHTYVYDSTRSLYRMTVSLKHIATYLILG